MVFSPWIKRGVWKTVCEWLKTEITEGKKLKEKSLKSRATELSVLG